MHENDISRQVLAAAFKVHTALGPGLLEAVHEAAIMHELRKASQLAEAQVPGPVVCDGVKVEVGYRLNLLVEKKVIVELKSVESFHPRHAKQLTNYLKLSRLKPGLLNFNVPSLKEGRGRIVNGL